MSLFTKMGLEVRSLSYVEKLFTFLAMSVGFCISCEYAMTRPSSHSLFLTVFSSSALPWLWLSTVPLNLFAISFYNRFLPLLGPLRMYALVSFIVVTINSLAFFLLPVFPKYIWIQCMWKDIYILLMFKQLWSMILTTIDAKRAKYLYGLIFSSGTLGACLGSFVPSWIAVSVGSAKLFLLTFPIYFVQFFVYRLALKRSAFENRSLQELPPSAQGMTLGSIFQNRFLMGILLLVLCMQTIVGLMDYRFNFHLEHTFLDQDVRTAYCGKVFGWMNLLCLGLQGVGSFLFIHTMGLKRTHLAIPMILCCSTIGFWVFPSFAMIVVSYVLMKALDLSVFSVGREMLYLPLDLETKIRAKALIDVFAYRSAKAFVSLVILALQGFAGILLMPMMNWVSVIVFAFWVSVVLLLLYPRTSTKMSLFESKKTG